MDIPAKTTWIIRPYADKDHKPPSRYVAQLRRN